MDFCAETNEVSKRKTALNRGISVATCGIIMARSKTENSLSFALS